MTTIKPYDYQEWCLQKLRNNTDQRQLGVMAPGLGKTFTAIFAIKERLKQMPGRIIVLCHQVGILDQWEAAFRLILGNDVDYGRFHGGAVKAPNARVMFGSLQAMAGRQRLFARDAFTYMIVDESHHAPAFTYLPTIEHFASYAQVLGLTATPNRADGEDITNIFGKPVFNLPIELALAKGFLARVKYVLLNDGLWNMNVLPTTYGNLNLRQLDKEFFAKDRDERIVELIKQHTSHLTKLHMMVFCSSVAHANRYEKLLDNSWAVHSKLSPRWQQTRIEDYREHRKSTIITVNKFNEGVDFPFANVGVMLRKHGTEMGFSQQIGRILRPDKGKEEALILDLACSCEHLLMMRKLYKRVRQLYGIEHALGNVVRPFEVSVGDFGFDAKTIEIIDLLEAIKAGCTRDTLKKQLVHKVESLEGRLPLWREIDADPEMASSATFLRIFGVRTLDEVFVAAGFKVSTESYREKLSRLLLAKAEQVGGSPTTTQVLIDPDLPHPTTFTKEFKTTWNGVLEAVGLPVKNRKVRAT